MAKFYVIVSYDDGETVGATTTLPKDAIERGDYGDGSFEVKQLDIPVNAETIRRMLAGGGYATNVGPTRVYRAKQRSSVEE